MWNRRLLKRATTRENRRKLAARNRYQQPATYPTFDDLLDRLMNDDAAAIEELWTRGVREMVARDVEILGKCFLLAFRLGALGVEPMGLLLERALAITAALDTVENSDRLVASGEKYGPMAVLPVLVGQFRINLAILMYLAEYPIIARNASHGIWQHGDALTPIEFSGVARITVERMHHFYLGTMALLSVVEGLDRSHKAEALSRRLVAEQYLRRLKGFAVSMVGAAEQDDAAFSDRFSDPNCPRSVDEEQRWEEIDCALSDAEIIQIRDAITILPGHSELALLTASALLGEAVPSLHSDVLTELEKRLYGPLPEPAMWARGVSSILAAEHDVQALMELLERTAATCARLPNEAGARARAQMNIQFVEAVSRIAAVWPAEAALLMSAFTFPNIPAISSQETRVWVVPGAAQSVALLQTSGSTVSVELPDLDLHYVMDEVGADFAEEFDGGYSSSRVSTIRTELSRQLRPLIVALGDCQGTTRIVGLGTLKHIPFAGLKRSGGSLATRPQLLSLSATATVPQQRPADAGRARTLLLIDQCFSNRPPDPRADWCVTRAFRSTADPATNGGLLLDLDEFDRFIFFGHAQVGQFQLDHDGLVLAEGSDEERLIFRLTLPPTGAFSRLREVILVACAAGQGKVFVDGAASLASGFIAYGAHYVVAPIWPITDDIGSRFIDQWFREELTNPFRHPVDTWGHVLEKDPNSFLSFSFFG
jgi:CHAT domain